MCKSRSLSDKNGLKLLIALTFLLVVVLNARAPVLRFEVYLAELVAKAEANAPKRNGETGYLAESRSRQVTFENLIGGKRLDDPEAQAGALAYLILATDAEQAEGRVTSLQVLPSRPPEGEEIKTDLIVERIATAGVTT